MIKLAVKSEINKIRYTMITFIDPLYPLTVNVLLLSTYKFPGNETGLMETFQLTENQVSIYD